MGELLKPDPAIERWVEMRHNLYKNFRWTGKSARSVLIWGAIVPISLYYLSSSTEGKWQLRGVGNKEGESISQK